MPYKDKNKNRERVREKRLNPEYKEKERLQRHAKMVLIEEKNRRKIYRDKYRSSLKGKLAEKRYKQSGKGKLGYLKSHLKRKYGLTIEDVATMLKTQNNRCLLCGDSFTEEKFHVVDHDHVSGKIRGLIHQKCNIMIGLANDDIGFLQMAVKYLTIYGGYLYIE